MSSNFSWKTHIHSTAKHASQKLGFLSRARGFFSPSQLLTIYKSQIHPSLEYCSHVWGGAPRSSLHLLDKVQSIAIRLINNPSLTKSLQSLSHLPLPFLNPTTYLPSNLTSTNWISSPNIINFPFSFFLCQCFVIGSTGLSLTLHTKKTKKNQLY